MKLSVPYSRGHRLKIIPQNTQMYAVSQDITMCLWSHPERKTLK